MAELTDYIAGLPEPARSLVDRFRLRTLALLPDAEEGMSYGMPALRYGGKSLVSVMVTKAGYSVYPYSGSVVAQVIDRLPGFSSTKGAIHFTDAQPIPDDVFDALVLARRAQIEASL